MRMLRKLDTEKTKEQMRISAQNFANRAGKSVVILASSGTSDPRFWVTRLREIYERLPRLQQYTIIEELAPEDKVK